MVQRRLVQLIFAAVLMGAAGVMLIATAIWAFTFEGFISRDLRRALDGQSLTTAGVVLLVIGTVLILCTVGVLVGPRLNRWVGLVSRLVGIVVGAIGAISGVWLVVYYPGWAITYTVLGAVIVYALALYERELRSTWPWAPLRAQVAKVFALNTKGVDVPRGAAVAGLLLITLVVTTSQHQERYFLSVAFGLLFVALSDPGGDLLDRLRRMAVVGAIGTLLTALGFGIGGDAWGFVVLATFVVTVIAGLAINVDLEALVAGNPSQRLVPHRPVRRGRPPHPGHAPPLEPGVGLAHRVGHRHRARLRAVGDTGQGVTALGASRDPDRPSADQVEPTHRVVRTDPGLRRLRLRRHCLRAGSDERRLDAGRHPDRHEAQPATIHASGRTAPDRRRIGRRDRLRPPRHGHEQTRAGGDHHRASWGWGCPSMP